VTVTSQETNIKKRKFEDISKECKTAVDDEIFYIDTCSRKGFRSAKEHDKRLKRF
jgi:hypothetical protein